MCGILGLFLRKDSGLEPALIKKSLVSLARLSESRGKDSSGLVFVDHEEGKLKVFKGTATLKFLLKRREVLDEIDRLIGALTTSQTSDPPQAFAVMGHSRLVTNGSQINDENNQPVVKDGVVAVHNGIVVNHKDLWSKHPDLHREFEIDTEVMLSLIRKHLNDGLDISGAVSKTLMEVDGTVAAAFLFNDLNALALASNNGSLYVLSDRMNFLAFASESYFLREMAKAIGLDGNDRFEIHQVASGKGLVLDLDHFTLHPFSFSDEIRRAPTPVENKRAYDVVTCALSDGRPQRELILDPSVIANNPAAQAQSSLLEFNDDRIQSLLRCKKCILPETFPFIDFDEDGICNYCRSYRVKNSPKPIEALFDLVEPYRRSDGGYECIVPYSGGRDSTYALHVVKNVLKLNPIAFTYDWGMVTDLARRNIARVCCRLGVENIIVSADIALKRKNIRNNVIAWLKKPNLGMVPLFMAGDKYFFYYTDQVKKQSGVRLNIWGINSLENTDFKVGFLRVPPDHQKKRIYSLSVRRQLQLLMGVGRSIVSNPSYLNSSVLDTVGSFISRSIVPHRDYYHLFDYFKWDENEIDKLVLEEYQWEKAIDTSTTWRIGDGTAAFYNYIYYTVAGFSEYDTFRSNQIREGMLTRQEAIKLVAEENRPRYASIKWYLDILTIDFHSAIKRINAIPKLYN